MEQGRRLGPQGEVALPGEDLVPVPHVEQGGQPVAAGRPTRGGRQRATRRRRRCPPAGRSRAGSSRRARRAQNRRRLTVAVADHSFTSSVEMRKPERTKKTLTEMTPPPAQLMPAVVEHDAGDGDGTDAVEGRHVGQGRPDPGRHRRRRGGTHRLFPQQALPETARRRRDRAPASGARHRRPNPTGRDGTTGSLQWPGGRRRLPRRRTRRGRGDRGRRGRLPGPVPEVPRAMAGTVAAGPRRRGLRADEDRRLGRRRAPRRNCPRRAVRLRPVAAARRRPVAGPPDRPACGT